METETIHAMHRNLEKVTLDMDHCDELINKYLILDDRLGISRIFSSMGVKPRVEKYTELGLGLIEQRSKVTHILSLISEDCDLSLTSDVINQYPDIMKYNEQIVAISDEISHGVRTMEKILSLRRF